MREIKFRVIKDNTIVGYERLTDNGWVWTYLEMNPEGYVRWVKGVFNLKYIYTREQFTGLRDKNGTDIYEKDRFFIPSVGQDPRYIGHVEYDTDMAAFVVVKTNGGWDYLHLFLSEYRTTEVIAYNTYPFPTSPR